MREVLCGDDDATSRELSSLDNRLSTDTVLLEDRGSHVLEADTGLLATGSLVTVCCLFQSNRLAMPGRASGDMSNKLRLADDDDRDDVPVDEIG